MGVGSESDRINIKLAPGSTQFTLNAATADTLLTEDDNVDWFIVQNQGDDAVRLGLGFTPTTTKGILLAGGDTAANIPGGSYETPAGAALIGDIKAIAVSGTPVVEIQTGT